ncbi:hypothetical protein AVEN_100015-1 [Araneus ventricosus]|uniref:Uncharacterized protein n=1 Tax=Araneus ventricosus TaxID=182803 RepID=A0A4Y2BLU4_ARAVE|nr:hypothetical protein AVEN_100015-1 [Araneus ventricosus]
MRHGVLALKLGQSAKTKKEVIQGSALKDLRRTLKGTSRKAIKDVLFLQKSKTNQSNNFFMEKSAKPEQGNRRGSTYSRRVQKR